MATINSIKNALAWLEPLNAIIKVNLSNTHFNHQKYWTLTFAQIITIYKKETQNA